MGDFKVNCKNLPKIFFDDKNVAKNHFRQFGRIKKMIFKQKSRACLVEYATLDGAQKAVEFGCMYENHVFEVVRESPLITKKRIRKQSDPEWLPDPEVMDELDAMGGGPSVGLKKYNLRPEAMETGIIAEKPKTILKRNWHSLDNTLSKKRVKPAAVTPKFEPKLTLSDEQLELVEIVKRPAYTTDEKYKVLDARDKLIRFLLKRDSNKKTGATQGTCSDMCPEKERLLRSIQHQLSIYEQDSTKELNATLVVKQYSRSSADQEASLPHELRPVEVLQMTMSYLIHQIMSLGDNADVNIGDWYYFLWDRTRSIRKDITQQELCSRGSVALVEQCARFHIHCSSRLVAEEPSVFDQKINTENLTKCLQTLKYMYNDLRLKGEVCPEEAEFRGYVILLNLNDGNFMAEVQKLPLEIQKSKEVKAALDIYSALDKNNFIKFFKLVNSTTYLNACILMRYFMQVRIRAITILLKCYTSRITKVIYPLDELTSSLAFESVGHTMEFLHNCGLSMNTSKTGVVLDRTSFSTPEFTYMSLDRSVNIVECKRKNFSIGHIVCGGLLPPKDFEYHLPENSFNDKGFLKMQYFSLADLAPFKRVTGSMESIPPNAASKNPYLMAKGVQENLLSNPMKPVPHDAFIKKGAIIPNPKSSIFSLDNRMKEEKTVKANIFGGSIKTVPLINDQDMMKHSVKPILKEYSQEQHASQGGPTTIFGNNSQKIDIPVKTDSLFGTKAQTAPDFNIFGGSFKEPNFSGPSLGVINTSENNISTTNNTIIAESASTIFGNKMINFDNNDLIPKYQKPKDEIDFKTIKWDIDSPEKEKKAENTVENIFFQPSSLQSNVALQTSQQTIGGFRFEGFSFAPMINSNQMKNPNDEQLETEKLREQKERQMKIAEEREKLEKEREKMEKEREKRQREKEKMLRRLEIEREIANQKRKVEEERARKIREEEHEKEMERKRIKELERNKMKEIALTVSKLLSEVVDNVEIQIRKEKLEELKAKIEKRILSNILRKWHNTAVKIRKKRKALDCSPIWACPRTLEEEAEQLKTESQYLTLKYMRRYKLGKPLDLSYDDSVDVKSLNYIELSEILAKRYCDLGQKFFKDIFWKGIVSLPDEFEMANGRARIEETLQKLFQWKDQNGKTIMLEQFNLNQVQTVKYCIEKQTAVQIEQCDANGYIFIGENLNQSLSQRIIENIKNCGIFVRIPIVLILQEKPPNSMNLKVLIEAGIISNYLIIVDNFSPKRLLNNIEKGLKFLLSNSEIPPPVQLDTMKAFLIKNLCTEIWKKANSFCKWNSVYKDCLRKPSVAIDLYNDAVERLKKLILNKSCYEFANFPLEFKELLPSEIPDCLPCDYKYFPIFCKDETYFKHISEVFKKLEMAPIKQWPPKNQTELENILSNYCTEMFEDPFVPFHKILAIFLKSTEKAGNFMEVKNVVWTYIIEVLALEKIKEVDFSLNDTEYFNKSIFNQLVVIYNPESLNEYTNTDWFYVSNPIVKEQIESDSYMPVEKKKPNYDITNEEVDEAILKAKSMIRDVDFTGIKCEITEFKSLLSDLEESLLVNKKISSSLNDKLLHMVKDN